MAFWIGAKNQIRCLTSTVYKIFTSSLFTGHPPHSWREWNLDEKMSLPSPYLNQDSTVRFRKRKARFSFSEVHILLDEVRKNRHIVVGEFPMHLTSKHCQACHKLVKLKLKLHTNGQRYTNAKYLYSQVSLTQASHRMSRGGSGQRSQHVLMRSENAKERSWRLSRNGQTLNATQSVKWLPCRPVVWRLSGWHGPIWNSLR